MKPLAIIDLIDELAQGVSFRNISEIRVRKVPFSFLETLRYRPRIASTYSSMLPRVISPPLGSTIYEATISLSVTLIMG
jgi:hypothetical protein